MKQYLLVQAPGPTPCSGCVNRSKAINRSCHEFQRHIAESTGGEYRSCITGSAGLIWIDDTLENRVEYVRRRLES